jgi:tetratricopeptide (TPR) repeat protein
MVEARTWLRHFRNDPLQDPTLFLTDPYDPQRVIHLAEKALSTSLPDVERYNILEQLLVAYLDVGKVEKAVSLLSQLETQFRGSRMEILRARILEVQGNYEAAMAVYTKQLEIDPTHMGLSRRRAMAHVAKGDRTKAIEYLVQHVDTFAQDVDAWISLAKLYCQHGFYKQAVFCYEELMLLKPKDHVSMLHYAELVYGLGQWETALQYYCSVVEIVPDCLMAWYGIHLTTRSLLAAKRGDMDRYQALHHLSKKQIQARYPSGTLSIVVQTFLK